MPKDQLKKSPPRCAGIEGYTDPLVVRSLLKNGMADAVVQRAFLKDIPFSIFEPTGRA